MGGWVALNLCFVSVMVDPVGGERPRGGPCFSGGGAGGGQGGSKQQLGGLMRWRPYVCALSVINAQQAGGGVEQAAVGWVDGSLVDTLT